MGVRYGLASLSAEETGMIKAELKLPKLNLPIGKVDVGGQLGGNLIESLTRLAEPVRAGMDKLNFFLSKEMMVNEIQSLRMNYDIRIESLRQLPQTDLYWVPAYKIR